MVSAAEFASGKGHEPSQEQGDTPATPGADSSRKVRFFAPSRDQGVPSLQSDIVSPKPGSATRPELIPSIVDLDSTQTLTDIPNAAGTVTIIDNGSDDEQQLTPTDLAEKKFGFTTLNNTNAVATVAKALGRPFKAAPAVVQLTGENLTKYQKLVEDETFDRTADTAPYYDPPSKIIFADREDHPDTRIHETAHAGIDEIAPELYEAIDRVNDLLDALEQGEQTDVEGIKQGTFAQIVHEGLAEEITIGNVSPKEKYERKKKLLTGMPPNTVIDFDTVDLDESIEPDMEVIKGNFSMIEKRFTWSQQANEATDQSEQEAFAELATMEIGLPIAKIGYYFASGVMDHLRDNGVAEEDLPQWRRLVAQNVPQSLDEFRDPAEYVERLQAKITGKEDQYILTLPERKAVKMGFTTTDISEEISIVNDRLAHTFEQNPTLVILDPENAAVLEKQIALGTIKSPPESSAHSWFDSKHKITFMKPLYAESKPAKIHEIAHAAIGEIAPDLVNTEITITEDKIKQIISGEIAFSNIVEDIFIAKLVDEGIAMWLELDANPDNVDAEMKHLQAKLRNETLATGGVIKEDHRSYDEKFAALAEAIKAADGIFSTSGEIDEQTRAQNLQKVIKATQGMEQYTIGTAFIMVIAKKLRDEGLQNAEVATWLKTVMHNRPKHLEEFRDPVSYLEQLRDSQAQSRSSTPDKIAQEVQEEMISQTLTVAFPDGSVRTFAYANFMKSDGDPATSFYVDPAMPETVFKISNVHRDTSVASILRVQEKIEEMKTDYGQLRAAGVNVPDFTADVVLDLQENVLIPLVAADKVHGQDLYAYLSDHTLTPEFQTELENTFENMVNYVRRTITSGDRFLPEVLFIEQYMVGDTAKDQEEKIYMIDIAPEGYKKNEEFVFRKGLALILASIRLSESATGTNFSHSREMFKREIDELYQLTKDKIQHDPQRLASLENAHHVILDRFNEPVATRPKIIYNNQQ